MVEDVLMILNYNSYGNDDSHGTDLKLWNKLRNEKLESLELEKDKLNDNFIYVTIAYILPQSRSESESIPSIWFQSTNYLIKIRLLLKR